ncbi:hypothetical protein GY659_25815, partial [Escherichia coli]|nr:hypothetical protein [Escherichia coli]
EFVQQTWVLNPNFATLYDETDPLIGPKGTMTIPEDPLRRIIEVETFVLGADDMVTFSANADEADRRHFWQVPARGGVAQRVTE